VTLVVLLLSLLAVVGLTGCGSASPDAGHQIVLVSKPLIFGHGGIDPEPVSTGRTFTALTTEGVDVNMQPQKYEVEMDDTQTSDGIPVTFHAIMVLKVNDSVALITNFGDKWYENNLLEPYKTMVRQAVRKHTMNETAISTTALDAIDAEIHDQLVSFIKEKKLPIDLITMTVGKANPPESVKEQRIATATQEQRIQTEQQTKLAEDQRKAAEQSRAAADNAYREAMGLSPEQFLRLETIKMEREACKTATCILGGGATPVLPVGK